VPLPAAKTTTRVLLMPSRIGNFENSNLVECKRHECQKARAFDRFGELSLVRGAKAVSPARYDFHLARHVATEEFGVFVINEFVG